MTCGAKVCSDAGFENAAGECLASIRTYLPLLLQMRRRRFLSEYAARGTLENDTTVQNDQFFASDGQVRYARIDVTMVVAYRLDNQARRVYW